jgi:Tfp pilus assembly protein PilV
MESDVDGTFEKRTIDGSAGFSLIEAMLALALLTGGCLAAVGMFVVGDRALARAAHTDEALALARGVLEWKRVLPYEQLDEDDLDSDGRADGRSPDGTDEIGSFHRTWRVRRDQPWPGFSVVSVEIAWSDEQGRPHHLAMAMVRADVRSVGLR